MYNEFRFFYNLEILIVNNEKKWQQRMVNAPYFFGERAIFFKSVFIHFFSLARGITKYFQGPQQNVKSNSFCTEIYDFFKNQIILRKYH